jgi:7-carboxy-7-deazaguanine synthase
MHFNQKRSKRFDPSRERSLMGLDTIFDELTLRGTDMLVVSGGEPLLQQRRLLPLLQVCSDHGWRIEIETAATLSPLPALSACVTQFNVSPKLANSGNERDERYRPEAMDALQETGKSVWKFVVLDRADLAEIDDLVGRHGLRPIYVMPEGTQPDVIIQRASNLADDVLAHGWNMTMRLQILLWGNQRSV